MPDALRRIFSLSTKDIAPVNSYEGFQSNGAVVLRDRRGTVKAELPEVSEKSFGEDPLAIYKPTGAKSVSPAKAMANFNGWTFAAVNAIASEVANIQLRLYKVTGDDHEEQDDHPLMTLLDGVNERMTGIELKYVTMAHLELTRNLFVCEMDQPRALYLVDPGGVRVKLDKSALRSSQQAC
jgi:Phage portal protein